MQNKLDMVNGVELLLSGLSEVMAYSRQKALYEADCRVREDLAKLRSVSFVSNAAVHREVVVDLAQCKFRLRLLVQEYERLPISLQRLMAPLLEDLKRRIADLRQSRKDLVRGARSDFS